jgi:hypothetical protein
MRYCVLIVLIAVAGCADISVQGRWRHADQLAAAASWKKITVPAGKFVLTAYVPKSLPTTDTLTVYIEGDGLAWLSRSQPSADPTPRNPVGLELALRDPSGTAVYLARPCQYVATGDARNCSNTYWTGLRFAPEVIAASDQAIGVLKRRYASNALVLVGYSGGGAVAALVAARRNDVAKLITVAGNLDHRAWTDMHHVPPLEGSLNAADAWQALENVPQWHLVGARDEVVGSTVIEAYVSRFPPDRRPKVITVAGFSHVCCWADRWPGLLAQAIK